MNPDLEKFLEEGDFAVSIEWIKEIHRRCLEIDNGQAQLIESDAAMERLQKKYS